MISRTEMQRRVDALLSATLANEDKEILRDVKTILLQQQFNTDEAFNASYESDYMQFKQLVDLFEEYYRVLADTLSDNEFAALNKKQSNKDSDIALKAKVKKMRLKLAAAAADTALALARAGLLTE